MPKSWMAGFGSVSFPGNAYDVHLLNVWAAGRGLKVLFLPLLWQISIVFVITETR